MKYKNIRGTISMVPLNIQPLKKFINENCIFNVYSITRIANISKQFKDWYAQNCRSYIYNMIDSENDIEV